MYIDLEKTYAFRWNNLKLEPIIHLESVENEDLLFLDSQKKFSMKNIQSFVSSKPFLNMLFTGPRGTGKSSLVKMLLTMYKNRGLRVVEYPQECITSIYNLYSILRDNKSFFFLLFFDDISFDESDVYYRKFKSIMEGGLEETPTNCMFIATSNKRHMIKEKAFDSADIYNSDLINEDMSLFARFGLSLIFPLWDKDQYLALVDFYFNKFSIKKPDMWQREAENFAINRGGRSARVAKQFVIFCHFA
jgi:predicted AAA+ superfamily ATPase